jgi:hypothetical protein
LRKPFSEEDNSVNDFPDPLPDVAISVGAVAVARRAHELGLTLTPAQCDELARAALEAGTAHLTGADTWPPLPNPES